MWICVRCHEREIALVDTADDKAEITKVMLNDMIQYHSNKKTLNNMISHGNAGYSEISGWSDYQHESHNWKCFWV